MAFKLKKNEAETLSGHAENLRTIEGEIKDAISRYNNVIEEARGFIEDRASTWRGEYDDKSETWQESDRGSEVNEFISSYEEVTLDEIEEPDASAADEIDNLGTEVEG